MFHPKGYAPIIPLTNLRHSLHHATFSLFAHHSNFFSSCQSFTESIHLFRWQPTKRHLVHSSHIHPFRNPIIPCFPICPNHRRTLSSILSSTHFVTPYSSLIRTFVTVHSPNTQQTLKSSICTSLVLDLSFFPL